MATKKQIEHAWQKGEPIKGKNPNLYRKDEFGNEIYKPSYGKVGKKGWEVDHSKPKAKGGTNSKKNLKPIQTRENRRKRDKYPYNS